MRRPEFLTVLFMFLLAGCSFAPIRIAVQDIAFPADASGDICYVRIQESAPVNFTNATYTADATFQVGGLAPDTVRIQIYGRSAAPALKESADTFCVAESTADLVLSEEITLEPGGTKSITIGGGTYGARLADLIAEPTYYLGVTVAGGSLVGTDSIVLDRGVISVYF